MSDCLMSKFLRRLTPALAVVYFFQVTIARRIATGPLSIYLANVATDACYDQWWSFFFYFQNYAKDGDKLVRDRDADFYKNL